MLSREGLRTALLTYHELRGRRGRYEFLFWLAVFVLATVAVWIYMEPPDLMAGAVYGFGMAGCALIGALVHRRVDRQCREKAGLVCPKCQEVLTERGALYMPLEFVCEHCGRQIYACSGDS
jgi:hypothetical protein